MYVKFRKVIKLITAYPAAQSEYSRLSFTIIFTMLNCKRARITAIAVIY